jgi:tRNA-2-methylthio-N6-dimethylallyladenosine synthase
MPSVFIKTYGCQMNERDSEAVLAQLAARGYSLALAEADADVILLNTCSVRDMAEQKAIGKMRALVGSTRKASPRDNPGLSGVHGPEPRQEISPEIPGVRLVLGTQKFHRTGEYLDALLARPAQWWTSARRRAANRPSASTSSEVRDRGRPASPRS